MAFTEEPDQIPTDIGIIQVRLVSDPTDTDRAFFTFEVLDQSGALIKQLSGNLVPHLTPAQIQGLLDFMADLRTQAVNEVIGTP